MHTSRACTPSRRYEYKASLSNCFDGSVTVLSVVVAVVAIDAGSAVQTHGMIRYVLALRLGRFCRLLARSKQVALVVATFLRMIPAAAKLLQVLFVTLFIFSTVGMQLFGGVINYGPQYAALQATSFGQAGYYANNFNDLASGFVVCFELLVVNNWFILAGGFAHVAYMPLVRAFFVAVYVLGVLVCLNIVIAFAIDAFNAAQQAANEADEAASSAGGDDDPDGTGGPRGEMREHSDSISLVARNFHPVVPVSLQASESLKHRLKNLKQPRLLVAPAEATRSEDYVERGARAQPPHGLSNGLEEGAEDEATSSGGGGRAGAPPNVHGSL